jgi:hypothetical protein
LPGIDSRSLKIFSVCMVLNCPLSYRKLYIIIVVVVVVVIIIVVVILVVAIF